MNPFLKFLLDPAPMRSTTLKVMEKFSIGSYKARVELGAAQRPHYGHCLYTAADLAARLGLKKISALEFGVAAGAGLLSLEYHASEIEKLFGVEIELYGFDTGKGLPAPQDYRDLPHHWAEGFYEMDREALEKRLTRAKLVLGNVENTVPSFFEEFKPAPVGAILFDLDFYSSTMAAFKLLEAAPERLLPRIWCYFDDVAGNHIQAYSDYAGVRGALNDYNAADESRKFSPAYYLLCGKYTAEWHKRIWIHHDFSHPLYTKFVSEENQQLALK